MYYPPPPSQPPSVPVPPSPAAGSAADRKIAVDTWRRQQQDALRRVQMMGQMQQDALRYMPPPPAPPPSMVAAGRGGAAHDPDEIEQLKRHVAEMRRYFKFWVRREGHMRTVKATKIQAAYRAYLTRQRLLTTQWRYARLHRRRFRGAQNAALHEAYPTLATILPRPSQRVPRTFGHGEHAEAVAEIQRVYRGHRVRWILGVIQTQGANAVRIQAAWRGWQVRRVRENPDPGQTLSSQQLGALYTMIGDLRRENERQRQRSDAQEKALRLLWDEVTFLRGQVDLQTRLP